jgi:uncharacterized protein YqjF (DUF2071 family)
MECISDKMAETREPSAMGRRRMLEVRGNPLFVCDWSRAVFIHYEVDAEALQREVPFALDLDEGRAYLSLVAFTMRGMRPRVGGRIAAMLLRPIATHGFLNIRAYVKHGGEAGIYFLAEWLPNRLSRLLGPSLFGLPYRYGRLNYRHEHEKGVLRGTVSVPEKGLRLEYSAAVDSGEAFRPCAAESREEFLMERYTAFTANGIWRGKFRIWHPPWPQKAIDVRIDESSLLEASWPWFRDARLIGANSSPGFREVWMGRPQTLGR